MNSETERRLTAPDGSADGGAKLQVYYPHLRDTVEVLQVNRVLRRMNRFMRFMHEDLRQPEGGGEDRPREFRGPPDAGAAGAHRPATQDGLPDSGETPRGAVAAVGRVARLDCQDDGTLQGDSRADAGEPLDQWEDRHPDDALIGTANRDGRVQPFSLLVRSFEGRLMLRCVSPIGRAGWEIEPDDPGREASNRVTWLIDRVTAAADRLERKLVEGEADRTLDDFRKTLEGGSEIGD